MAKLTAKQQRFADEYLIDLNATQAAIRAGYSVKTANEQGARLLANVSISNAIALSIADRAKRTGFNQDRVLGELAGIAFDADGHKTADRLKALELLGKHLGLFVDRVEATIAQVPTIVDDIPHELS